MRYERENKETERANASCSKGKKLLTRGPDSTRNQFIKKQIMKYFSLFSGIGGFEVGIQNAVKNLQELRAANARQADEGSQTRDTKGRGKQLSQLSLEGLSCVGYSEIDKYAIQIYQSHFPEHKNYGDITKIDTSELPDFDLLVGGFPCQSFSIAGKRGGFNDTRGTLFFEIARILKDKQPKFFVLENVKGLLSHDGGRTIKIIISTLTELGYDVQWQVLNSKDFGVPQNRERIFIVGYLRGTSRPEVFPFAGTNEQDSRNVGENLSYALDANYAKGTNTLEKGRRQLIQLNQPKHSNDRVYDPVGISPTLNTMQGGNRQPFIYDLKATENSTRRGIKSNKGFAKTLDHNCAQGVEQGTQIRRLTPLECERLQGFPDKWTQRNSLGRFMSDTQRYKCCGNAVTTNVIQAIMERLLK